VFILAICTADRLGTALCNVEKIQHVVDEEVGGQGRDTFLGNGHFTTTRWTDYNTLFWRGKLLQAVETKRMET
jgi:hypothetical protein